jgi:hypothetical protein
MLLLVPNGKVKLPSALLFAPADLRRDSLDQAWVAYRHALARARGARIRAGVPDEPSITDPRRRDWPMRGH